VIFAGEFGAGGDASEVVGMMMRMEVGGD